MPRLNVDDDWFLSDPRRSQLAKITGCYFKADGMALAAWRLAQRYWKYEKQLIPLEIWDRSELQPLIEAGLARIEESGVYVCGTRSHHDWLFSRSEAGRAGGLAKASKAKQTLANASKRKQTVASYSSSSSISKKEDMSESNSDDQGPIEDENKPKPAGPRDLAELWNTKASSLPAVNLKLLKAGSDRWRRATSRLREHPDLAYWSETIERMARTPFCLGENKSGWRANFDFLLQPDTHIKVGEGKYDSAINGNGHASPPKRPRREMGTDI